MATGDHSAVSFSETDTRRDEMHGTIEEWIDELRETAEANGWSEREFREARRDTDRLVNVGTTDEPRVVLNDTAADTDDDRCWGWYPPGRRR